MDIPLLKVRREKLCEQFFYRNMNNDKLCEFLISKTSFNYSMRPRCKYSSYLYETERFRKSFYHKLF